MPSFIARLSIVVLLLAGGVARAQQARNLSGDAVEEGSRFRGSTAIYEHLATAISASKSFDPQWNPYYAHNLSLRPEFHPPGKPFFFRLRLNVSQELTMSDQFNSAHEVVLNDAQLEAVWPGWTEPKSKIRIGASARVAAPISKASLAQTLVTNLSPAFTLIRPIKLEGKAGAVIVGYTGRFSKNFNRSTSPVMDGPRIPCTDPDSPVCARLSTTGFRNVSWSLSHGPLVIYSPLDELSFTFSYSQIASRLYGLSPAAVETDTGLFTLPSQAGVNARWTNFALVDATYTFTPEFSLALGAYTWSSALDTDGKFRNPFVNRFSSLYLDFIIDMERLAHRLQ